MNNLSVLALLTSVAAGAFFGILGNKMISGTEKSKWIWAFYLLGIATMVYGALSIIIEFKKIWCLNWGAITIVLLSLGFGLLILISTTRLLVIKNVYRIGELNPIINQFTKLADRAAIKLFGGDLNFFGDTPAEMDNNSQYNQLRAIGFNRIYILCEQPGRVTTKIRYGKLLADMPTAELGFYDPEQADLSVRGRLIAINGVNKLLMYTKVRNGYYRAIETDTANSNGALYNNIWELVWAMSQKPAIDGRKQEYIQNFQGG